MPQELTSDPNLPPLPLQPSPSPPLPLQPSPSPPTLPFPSNPLLTCSVSLNFLTASSCSFCLFLIGWYLCRIILRLRSATFRESLTCLKLLRAFSYSYRGRKSFHLTHTNSYSGTYHNSNVKQHPPSTFGPNFCIRSKFAQMSTLPRASFPCREVQPKHYVCTSEVRNFVLYYIEKQLSVDGHS